MNPDTTDQDLHETVTVAKELARDGAGSGAVFDHLLAEFLKSSESEYGFIGEVFVGDDGRPFLRTHAITNIAWNDETRSFYEQNAPDGLEFFNLQTLFGAVIISAEPLIANAPASHPRSGGLPDGHPPMHSFLGLPLSDADGMVGMLGMANRPGGYDQELVRLLNPLMKATTELIRICGSKSLE